MSAKLSGGSCNGALNPQGPRGHSGARLPLSWHAGRDAYAGQARRRPRQIEVLNEWPPSGAIYFLVTLLCAYVRKGTPAPELRKAPAMKTAPRPARPFGKRLTIAPVNATLAARLQVREWTGTLPPADCPHVAEIAGR